MNLQEALILLFTHGIPILFFTYMATDVLLRNQKNVEHILLSLISVCYLLLFAEEFVRNQVAIEYSPILSALWLSSVGIIIPGLGFHFLIKFTRLDEKMPRFIYPYIFYVPLIFVIINIVTGAKLISAQEFVQSGMWNLPVYNSGYYIALTASLVINVLYLFPLFIAKSTAAMPEQKSIYNRLIIGFIITIIWHILFGYINFGGPLPPYPYLYGGLIWYYFLRITMKKHDFLNLYDKRYEKLFNMNPDAILLMDQHKAIKHANPGAEALFTSLQLDFSKFFQLIDQSVKEQIRSRKKISHCETEIIHHNRRIVLLINADYVLVDNEIHVLFIFRDITVQKEQQEEIQFLAYHDPLTRLPNRRYFYEKLDDSLKMAKNNDETVALLLIDLDKLKYLNDTYGHLAGDEALKKVAQIISETVANRGTAARMGGDEFILYIDQSPTRQEMEQTIQHMQEEFSRYISKYGEAPVGLSIGMSFFPTDGNEGQALINIADQAMYEMKRNSFV